MIPAEVQDIIREAAQHYDKQMLREVPEDRWHVTMAFLGGITDKEKYLPALTASLAQAFVPAISITHLGEGKKKGQLWAYVNITNQLQLLHDEVLARVESAGVRLPEEVTTRPFVPHVRIGDVKPGKFGVLDAPAIATFRFAELQVLQSHQMDGEIHYSTEGAISLT